MNKMLLEKCIICGENALPWKAVKDDSISQEVFHISHCENCQFRFTSDAPRSEFISPYYKSEDYISHSDSTKGVINSLYHLVRNKMLKRKVKLIQSLTKGKNILDYGAGTGYFPAALKKNGFKIDAYELDEEARQYALEVNGINLQDAKMIFNNNNLYDVITMWHVLEHLYDAPTYLQKFHQILDKNGYLVIAVPNFTSSDGMHYQEKWAGYDVPRHLWHFSPKSMELFLNKNGFELHSIRPMPFDGFYVSMLTEKYKGTILSPIAGAFRGFLAYLSAIGNPQRSSSIIYIAQKK